MIIPSYSTTATERVLPRLALDFTTGTLDPRVTVTRALNTATRINSNGLIEVVNADLPRFDYSSSSVGTPRGLLIEEARTNIVTYSNDFRNTATAGSSRPWVYSGITVSTDATTSPDGAVNADKLVENTANSLHYIFYELTLTGSTTYAISLWLKAGERTRALISGSGDAWGTYSAMTLNLSAGTVGAASGAFSNPVMQAFPNGWYRLTFVGVSRAVPVANAQTLQIVLLDAAGNATYLGDGTSGFFVSGAQLEAGAFATSYIPTTATSLTRNADVVSMTGTNFSSWFNATVSGSATASATVMGGSNNTIYTFDNTASGLYADLVKAATNHGGVTGRVTFVTSAAGVTTYIDDRTGQTTNNTRFNTAFTFANSKFASTTNAATPFAQASGAVPASFNILRLGSHRDGTILNGWLSKFAYYAPLFTSAETQAFSK